MMMRYQKKTQTKLRKMMKNFLGLVLLIGTLLGNVDTSGYFPSGEQEEAKLSAGMIVMIDLLY